MKKHFYTIWISALISLALSAGIAQASILGDLFHKIIPVGGGANTVTPLHTSGGSGTVTGVSIVTANGFAGTVASSSTTPAITLTTTITGLLKGNGTAISAAALGIDYLATVSRDATLTGAGTAASPLGIDLAHANTWSGQQTFGTLAPIFSTLTINGGVHFGNGSGLLLQTASGATTAVLHGGTTPSFSAVDLTNDVTGNLLVTRLNSGTSATSSTYWRGDGVWASVAAAAGGSSTQVQYNNSGLLGGISGATSNGTTLTFASGALAVAGTSSGTTLLNATATASGVLTFPAATDVLIGRATTDTLTNKTYDTAGAGNLFSINSQLATSNTGTGSVVRATSPSLTTPTLGAASATTLNKYTFTTPASGATLTIIDGKTATFSNSISFSGTDGKGINIGAATSGKVLVGDGSNMVLSTMALPVTTTASSRKLMVSNGTDWIATTETFATPATSANVLTSDGTNWLSSAPSFAGMVENISFEDSNTGIAAQTYTLELYANYAYTVNKLYAISASGSATVAVKINGTNVTGISAMNVTATIASAAGTAANTVAVGDLLTLVISSASGLNDLKATLKTTRN